MKFSVFWFALVLSLTTLPAFTPLACLASPAQRPTPVLVVQLPPGSISSAATGGNLSFQWDARSGVRLQSTPSLLPTAWQDVPGSLGLENFTVPIGNADEFFRLFRP